MEILISQVLRAGVVLSAAIVTAGVVLLVIQGAGLGAPSLAQLDASGSLHYTVSPRSIWQGVIHLQATAVIELGLVVLILTPVARVAMTVALFAKQHDHAFTVITAIVLLVLLISFFGLGA